MQPQFIPITEPEKIAAAGLPWDTRGKIQWAFRQRRENGLADAFRRQGRKILIDPIRAHELLRQMPAA